MKKKICLFLALSVLILSGCRNAVPAGEIIVTTTTYQTDPVMDPENISSNTEPILQIDGLDETNHENVQDDKQNQNESGKDSDNKLKPTQIETVKPTDAPVTKPAETYPKDTKPKETTSPETKPPVTEPPATEAPTEPEQTEREETEPTATEITYEFKRQVASYAAQYINAYRGSPCTVLSGMSQVAQYRASQLTWNYGHSASDKRAALAYYEYGRYIDATEFGDDASNSYWEADSAEAICAGFYGTDPEAMGKRIADLIRNSSGHWSYISSSEYSYIGVGVEYREGSQYGWYACVMVGSVNYG